MMNLDFNRICVGLVTFISLALLPSRAFAQCPDSIPVMPPGMVAGCDNVPGYITEQVKKATTFRANCVKSGKPAGQLSPDGDIGINDLSKSPGTMYLFDNQGKCLGSTAVAYGGGQGNAAEGNCHDTTLQPVSCTQDKSFLTPPGYHAVGKCGDCKSTVQGLIPCERLSGLQGQNTGSRGVLIHGSDHAGSSCTEGCSGVTRGDELNYVLAALGGGGLLDNYFGTSSSSNSCSYDAGKDFDSSDGSNCSADAAGQSDSQNPAVSSKVAP